MEAYHQSIELVERFAECLLKESKNQNDITLVKHLASYIKYFDNEIQISVERDKIFHDFLNKIDQATEKLGYDILLQEFQKKIDEAKKKLKDSEKCEKYVKFMEMITKHNLDDSDVEIKTISETVNTIDPISRLPIVEPVKNKKCGHCYEKNSIFQLIEQNPRTKCPIAGCNAASFVKKSDLVPDTALKRILNNGSSLSSSNSQKKIKLFE